MLVKNPWQNVTESAGQAQSFTLASVQWDSRRFLYNWNQWQITRDKFAVQKVPATSTVCITCIHFLFFEILPRNCQKCHWIWQNIHYLVICKYGGLILACFGTQILETKAILQISFNKCGGCFQFWHFMYVLIPYDTTPLKFEDKKCSYNEGLLCNDIINNS